MLKKIFFLLMFSGSILMQAQSFKASQQKNARVKSAYSEKWETLQKELANKGIDASGFDMFIRVFKQDADLEVWLKDHKSKEYKLFKTYKICASSGDPGPKRKQGDGQVPEGFYTISAFNPYSSYYLSLGVSYPNASDKIIGKGNLGGDIMIHGNCVTIGCMPLTDVFIKEVYVLAVEAKNGGQATIPVHIFPTRLDNPVMTGLSEKYKTNIALVDFWKNIKTGYDLFEKNKTLPKVSVDKSGKYLFAEK
jgi:murein L,D-transpeptidase YafK